MHLSTVIFPSLFLSAVAKTCPFLGPVFPAPTWFTSPFWQLSCANLQATLSTALLSGNTSHGGIDTNDTYSIQIFGTTEESPLLDFHHRGAGVLGNRSIDGNSIYRIASTTKLLTVYMLLLQVGDHIFNDAVPKYLPELAGKQDWDSITVGALAGYVGGIVSDLYGTETIAGNIADVFPGVFPTLSSEEISPCVYGQPGCTRAIFLEALARRRPVFLPNSTPGYTNAAFATLGLILESLTGLSYAETLDVLLVQPFSLGGTTASAPLNSSHGVIVGDKASSGWDLIIDGAGIGMGGVFSTANDLSKIGRSILSSTTLPKNTTRAWLQPSSFTSSLIGAIGRPWEIFRAVLGPSENNRVVDLYTKGGNVAGYGANLVLIPDYGVGFVILQAGRRGRVPFALSGAIVDELLPALEEVARQETDNAYAGTYTAPDGLNSSLVLSTAFGMPGLSIDSWVSNGTDIAKAVFNNPETFQMFPTNIKSEDGKQHSWRSSFISIEDTGPFSACPSWVALDRPTYGVYGMDEFLFHLGEDGRAVAVEIKALKVVLQKG